MLHQIGVGALGPVFRTYEPERDRLVAVKAFRLDITPEQAQALAGELSLAADAGLFHPSIVEPIAAGVEGSAAYYAEEYVAAESLDVAMRHYAPAPVDTVLPYVTQLAGAIDFARAAGVGHGALHPRDVFVTPEEARATGFGVVEALERVSLRAPVRRPYTPPERIAGRPWSTPADVFSLAAITYELLTGRRPAGIGSEIGPLTAGPPDGPMGALHAVLARGMADEPSARFATALSFAAALKAAARGEVPADQPHTPAGAAAVVPSSGPAPGGPAAPIEGPVDPDVRGVRHVRDVSAAVPPTGADLAGARREPESGADLEESEDIIQEREDDDANYQLTLRELSEAAPGGSNLRMDPDPEADADSDRFLMDVAGVASMPPASPLDVFPSKAPSDLRAPDRGDVKAGEHLSRFTPEDLLGEDDPPRAARRSHASDLLRDPVSTARAVPAGASPGGHQPVLFRQDRQAEESVAARRRSRGPVALILVLGLLAGFVGGYALWGRPAAVPAPDEAGEAGTGGTHPGLPAAGVAEQAEEPAAGPGGSPAVPAPAAVPPAAAAPAPARPAAGTLVVRSTPSGAGVTVNGTWRGRTPLTLDKLPFARYQVRVVQPGYVPATQAVALSAGDPEGSMTVRLQQQPRAAPAPSPPAASPSRAAAFTGSIYVDSRPRGATVSINGKPVGVTPLRIPEMRIGSHVVRLELPDHRIWASTARVAAGQEVRVTGSLEPLR